MTVAEKESLQRFVGKMISFVCWPVLPWMGRRAFVS